MSILIDLKPEVHAELSRQAARRGVDLNAYAASLLEDAAQAASGVHELSHLDAVLNELTQFSHKIPALPDEALSRESVSGDSDPCRM